MKRAIAFIGVIAMALTMVPASRIMAQEEGEFTGQAAIGFRLVDVGGADRKFREDINLEDGPRLFDLQFEIVPQAGLQEGVDRIDLDLDNLGGDPFESFRLGVRKFAAYKFDYVRTKSTYFYNDIVLPVDLADPNKSQAGDFHTFDFDRIRDTATLKIDVTQRARATFGFERFTKKGESTTTLDVLRDEFEFDRTINESLNRYNAAFEYSFDKVTFAFEENVRDYTNAVEILLPGFSEGEDTADNATLSLFIQDLPYDFLSKEHTVRALAKPMDRLDVRFAGSFQNLGLDGTASEQSRGTDSNDSLVTTSLSGAGQVDRDIMLLDVDASYTLTDRVTITGGVRRNDLDQEGDFTFADALRLGTWNIETTGVEAGAEVSVTPEVFAHGGVMYEKRNVDLFHALDVDTTALEEDDETKNTGFFAGAGWRPGRMFELTFDAEVNSFDDPFTLASPTDRQRYRVRGQYRLENGLSFTGSFLFKDFENTNSDWNSDHTQADIRVGYQRGDVMLSGGYGNVNSETKVNQEITAGSRVEVFNILYDIESQFFDVGAQWRAHERVTVGGSFNHYQNDGSFGINREDLRTWVELGFGEMYLLHLGYRLVDYEEDDFDWDDYDSNIGEFSVGYKW
jgi:hypothetical protein